MTTMIKPNNLTPTANYLRHRAIIADRIRLTGIRKTARATGLSAMLVSRYCDATGGHDAHTHYVLAAAAGLPIRG